MRPFIFKLYLLSNSLIMVKRKKKRNNWKESSYSPVKRASLVPKFGDCLSLISRAAKLKIFNNKATGFKERRLLVINVHSYPDYSFLCDHLWLSLPYSCGSVPLLSTIYFEGKVDIYGKMKTSLKYGIPNPRFVHVADSPPSSLTLKQCKAILEKEKRNSDSIKVPLIYYDPETYTIDSLLTSYKRDKY